MMKKIIYYIVFILFTSCSTMPSIKTTKVVGIEFISELNEDNELEVYFKENENYYLTICYVNDTLFINPEIDLKNVSISICELDNDLEEDNSSKSPHSGLKTIYDYSNQTIKKDINGDHYITSKDFPFYTTDQRELSSFDAVILKVGHFHYFRIDMSNIVSKTSTKSKFPH